MVAESWPARKSEEASCSLLCVRTEAKSRRSQLSDGGGPGNFRGLYKHTTVLSTSNLWCAYGVLLGRCTSVHYTTLHTAVQLVRCAMSATLMLAIGSAVCAGRCTSLT
jgi:hypothetical protein